MNTKFRRVVTAALTASIVGTALPRPVHADIVGTDAALASAQRERIAEVLARPDVQAQLQAYGVEPAEAKARVAALSDEEAALLARQMETLPAGAGSFEGVVYLVLAIVLLPVIVVGGALVLAGKAIAYVTR
jgi:hypothetical protein